MKSGWSLASLPPMVSRWLGYRAGALKPHPLYRVCFWSFLGAWIGIAVLVVIGTYSPELHAYHSPLIIASFGASAVLLYGSIDAPLSQPRNAFFGHVIGALVGVIISKLFLQLADFESTAQYEAVRWVAGATATATAIVLMQVTTTVHPPGGATALIATVDDKVMAMGWYYIGIVAMSAALMIAIACLVNNIDRKYPAYWWRPTKLPLAFDPGNLATSLPSPSSQHGQDEDVALDMPSQSSSSSTLAHAILIDPARPLDLPDGLLGPDDIAALKTIHQKLGGSTKTERA